MKKTIVIGNLGNLADVKYTGDGKPYITFSVAVSEKVKDGEKTTWFNCVGWGERYSGGILPYLKKGTKVYLEGNYTPRLYTTNAGSQAISHDITVSHIELLLVPKDDAQQPANAAPAAETAAPSFTPPPQGPTDDLPF
jgi:single-strand DNA-binding protein